LDRLRRVLDGMDHFGDEVVRLGAQVVCKVLFRSEQVPRNPEFGLPDCLEQHRPVIQGIQDGGCLESLADRLAHRDESAGDL